MVHYIYISLNTCKECKHNLSPTFSLGGHIMCIDHQGFNDILLPFLVEVKQAWLLRCAVISADLMQKNKTSSNTKGKTNSSLLGKTAAHRAIFRTNRHFSKAGRQDAKSLHSIKLEV